VRLVPIHVNVAINPLPSLGDFYSGTVDRWIVATVRNLARALVTKDTKVRKGAQAKSPRCP
jgi:hypothetical protein